MEVGEGVSYEPEEEYSFKHERWRRQSFVGERGGMRGGGGSGGGGGGGGCIQVLSGK